jgi:signal transduction histidine kinase
MNSMLRRLFAAPVFPDDDDKTRTAFMMNAVLWMVIGAVTLGNLILIGSGDVNVTNVLITVSILVVIAALRGMVRLGKFVTVSMVISGMILLGTWAMVFSWGTIRVFQLSYLLIAFGIPTLLIGRRLGLIFLGLSIGLAAVMAQAEVSAWLPVAQVPTPANQLIVFTLTCIGIYLFLALSRWNTMKAIEKAERELLARQHSEKQIHLVANILRRLNAVTNVHQVFPEIAAELKKLTGCAMSGVVFISEDGQAFRVAALDHPMDRVGEGLILDVEQSAAAVSVRAGKVHRSPDLSQERDWRVEAYLADAGFRSMLTFPMHDSQRLWGSLSLLWKGESTYDEADVPMLEQIADALALSTARSYSFDEAKRRVQEADTLREASAILTETLDQEKAAQLILEQMQRVVPHHSASVMLLRDNYLEIIGGRGWENTKGVVGVRFPIPGDNPNTCVMETRQPLVLEDAPSLYAEFNQPPYNAAGPIVSWLGIPLIFRNRFIGMLTLDSPEPAHFTSDHVRLCTAFADQVAVVMENARLYAEARQRAADLEASVRELENFSYTLSHDLRAPLRAIDGYAHILMDEKGAHMDADEMRYVGQMASSARQMGRLLDDLLGFIRLGRHKLNCQPVALAELTHQVLAELRPELTGRTIEVQVGDLPPWTVDVFLFRQLFRELLMNAIRFTQPIPVARIVVGCQPTEYGLACFVRDNGIGFDMSYADHLFRVFHRLQVADEDEENTGVGLALAQRIVQQHGGRIWAESAPGQGATFYFTVAT